MTVEQIASEIEKIKKLKLKKSHYVLGCHNFNRCNKGDDGTCVGCNIWNLFYNQHELARWCEIQNENLISTIVHLSEKVDSI